MYRLKISLIGCEDELLPHVRRELLNRGATIAGEYADAAAAIEGLWPDVEQSHLFIVRVKNDGDLARLRQLSGTFVGRPVIALVEPAGSGSLVFKTMRAGGTQVVPLPLQREDFAAALDCIAVQFGGAAARARVIAVAGATAGCGATSVALNLAYEIGLRRHINCVLAEFSLRMGSLASYLDVEPQYTTSDLFGRFDGIDSFAVQQALTPIGEFLSILPGPYQAIEPVAPPTDDVLKLVDLIRPLTPVLVLDVPCSYDDLYFRTLAAADMPVLVAGQSVSSVRSAQMVCHELGPRAPFLVVNRYDGALDGFTADRLRRLLQPAGLRTVAQDSALADAANNGRPLRLQAPRSRALADFARLADELAPGDAGPATQTRPTFLDRLSRVLIRT